MVQEAIGGGTIDSTNKESWSGGPGFINGVTDIDLNVWSQKCEEEKGKEDYSTRRLNWYHGYSLPGTINSGNARLQGGNVEDEVDCNFGAARWRLLWRNCFTS